MDNGPFHQDLYCIGLYLLSVMLTNVHMENILFYSGDKGAGKGISDHE